MSSRSRISMLNQNLRQFKDSKIMKKAKTFGHMIRKKQLSDRFILEDQLTDTDCIKRIVYKSRPTTRTGFDPTQLMFDFQRKQEGKKLEQSRQRNFRKPHEVTFEQTLLQQSKIINQTTKSNVESASFQKPTQFAKPVGISSPLQYNTLLNKNKMRFFPIFSLVLFIILIIYLCYTIIK